MTYIVRQWLSFCIPPHAVVEEGAPQGLLCTSEPTLLLRLTAYRQACCSLMLTRSNAVGTQRTIPSTAIDREHKGARALVSSSLLLPQTSVDCVRRAPNGRRVCIDQQGCDMMLPSVCLQALWRLRLYPFDTVERKLCPSRDSETGSQKEQHHSIGVSATLPPHGILDSQAISDRCSTHFCQAVRWCRAGIVTGSQLSALVTSCLGSSAASACS